MDFDRWGAGVGEAVGVHVLPRAEVAHVLAFVLRGGTSLTLRDIAIVGPAAVPDCFTYTHDDYCYFCDAFAEGAHYFFMPNDDLKMLSPGWPVELLSILAASPGFPNLGVTGPIDPVSGRRDMPSMPMVGLCACISLSRALSRARASPCSSYPFPSLAFRLPSVIPTRTHTHAGALDAPGDL